MEKTPIAEQWKLKEHDEVVVPVAHGRFIITADQQKLKKRVLAPFSEDKRAECMNVWTFNSLDLQPMRTYIQSKYHDAPLQTRLMVKLENLFAPPIGIQNGAYVNVDVARIIRRIDGLSERYTDEEKEMLVKQIIDATLRHEEQHIRQDIRGDEIDTRTYWKAQAVAQGGFAAGVAGAGTWMLLLGYQQFAEAQASQSDILTTAAKVLYVASVATLSGSLALYCVNHRHIENTPAERDAREQQKPQYFSEQSPLEVSFERHAQQGNSSSF